MQLLTPASATAAPTLSVAQFNVENLFDTVDDPTRRDDVLDEATFRTRIAKLALTLRDTLRGADLVALAEVENQAVLDALLARPELTSLGYRSILVEGNDARGIDVAMLYRADRLRLDATETFNPSAPLDLAGNGGNVDPSRLFARRPLVAHFTLHGPLAAAEGARTLTAIANHFKSKAGEDPKKAGRRDLQAEAVAAWVDAHRAAKPGADVFVLGDLNAEPKDRAMSLLTKVPGGPDRLFDAPARLPSHDRYTGYHGDRRTMLDHVLATPELHARLESVEIPHVNTSRWGDPNDPTTPDASSDHDPILATYRLG